MITRDLECPWHDYCIICSYDVTGADFENSPYAFGQSEKRKRVQCIIIIINVRLSKQCLTRFIWPSRDIQEATVAVTWSSKVKLVSNITPRSLAASTGVSCFPSNESLKFRVLETPCLLPQTRSFVLSGFNSNWLSKHQLRILVRS